MKFTTRQQIIDGVREVLRSKLRIDVPVSEETNIVADLSLDSMQRLSLVVELENHFRICLDAADEQGVTTVGAVVSLIETRLARQAAA